MGKLHIFFFCKTLFKSCPTYQFKGLPRFINAEVLANGMSLDAVPRMTLEEMTKVLLHLPEPTAILCSVGGLNPAYSAIAQVIQCSVGYPVNVYGGQGGVQFMPRHPTKDLILQIYQMESETPHAERKIFFNNATWSGNGLPHITVDATAVVVRHTGPEPECIKRMREELDGTDVSVTIQSNVY